jgi:hypothetical protein
VTSFSTRQQRITPLGALSLTNRMHVFIGSTATGCGPLAVVTVRHVTPQSSLYFTERLKPSPVTTQMRSQ